MAETIAVEAGVSSVALTSAEQATVAIDPAVEAATAIVSSEIAVVAVESTSSAEVVVPDDEQDLVAVVLAGSAGGGNGGGSGEPESLVIWYDSETARVFPSAAATIESGPSNGDYETTEHLGQLAYAPPPGILDESSFYRTWVVEMPDALTSGNFTIEAWMRSSTASPPFGGSAFGSVELAWGNPEGSPNNIFMSAKVGLTTVESSELTLEHEVFFSSQYESDLSGGYQFDYQLFGATVQGWKHLCCQRIGNDDVFHYHGVRFNLTKGDESLPTPRPVTSDAQLIIIGENQATAGTAVGQVRASSGALYGTGNFIPPTEPFFPL